MEKEDEIVPMEVMDSGMNIFGSSVLKYPGRKGSQLVV